MSRRSRGASRLTQQPRGDENATLAPFARSVVDNLSYWRERTLGLGDPAVAGLEVEWPNLYRAVQFGLGLPEAWLTAAEVTLQVLPFARRRLLWPEWVPLVERLLAFCPKCDPRTRFKLLIELGRLHVLALRLSPAIELFLEAEGLADLLGDSNGRAQANYNLGLAFLRKRDYTNATRHGRALMSAVESGASIEPWLVAEAHRLLGCVAWGKGDLQPAETLLRQAVALRRAIGKRVELCRNLTDLANVLLELGEYDAAVATYEEAADLLAPTTSEIDKAKIQLNLGIVRFMQENWSAAELAFRSADTSWLRRSGNFQLQATAATNLANVLLKQARWSESESSFRRAIALWQQLDDLVELANVVSGLGEALAAQGQPTAAAMQFDRAMEVLGGFGDDAKAKRLMAHCQTEKAKLLAHAEAAAA